MKLLPEHTLTVPWYRSRLFWGIIFGILIAWGIFFFVFSFPQNRGFLETYQYLSLALGSGLFTFLGNKIFGGGEIFFTTLYNLLLIFLAYKTLSKTRVGLIYPILAVLLFSLGTFIVFSYISGLT